MSGLIDSLAYFAELGAMFARGAIYQLVRLHICGILLLGRGCRIRGIRRVRVRGVVKLGAFSVVDARFSEGITLGDRFILGDYSILRASGSRHFRSPGILIDDNVSFGPYCNIGGGFGLHIGRDCIFGPYVSIHPETHAFSDQDVPIRRQGTRGVGINIGTNNWFAAKVTILDGALVTSGSVFAAGAVVVSGRYTDDTIYAGVPAKPLKARSA